MKTFIEKDDYLIKNIPNLQVYRMGFDFSVVDGDDDYDYDNFTNRNACEMTQQLLEYFESETKQKLLLVSPFPYCKDWGNGDGYVKILVVYYYDYLDVRKGARNV